MATACSGFLPPPAAAAAGPVPPTVLVTNANGMLVHHRPLALLTSPLQVLAPWGGVAADSMPLGSPGAGAGANGATRPTPLLLYHLNSLPNSSPLALKSQWNLWM